MQVIVFGLIVYVVSIVPDVAYKSVLFGYHLAHFENA